MVAGGRHALKKFPRIVPSVLTKFTINITQMIVLKLQDIWLSFLTFNFQFDNYFFNMYFNFNTNWNLMQLNY